MRGFCGVGGRAYNFNTVEAGSDCTLGGMDVIGNCVLNLLNGHLLGSDSVLWPLSGEENFGVLQLGGRGPKRASSAQVDRMGRSSNVPQLAVDEPTL